MDKAALLKTISLLESEIETLMRAKSELLKELEYGSHRSKLITKIPRGTIQKFINNNLNTGISKTTDDLMLIVERQNLPIKRASLDAALHRGVAKGKFIKDENGFKLKPNSSSQADAKVM